MSKQLLAIIVALILAACTSVQYNTQESDEAYLQLQGNYMGTVLSIDGQQITIDDSIETFELNGEQVAKFPISLGKHQVKVSRANQVLYLRQIFVSNGQTVEVAVP